MPTPAALPGRLVALIVTLMVATSACTTSGPAPGDATASSSTASSDASSEGSGPAAAQAPQKPSPRPRTGRCYRLSRTEAVAPVPSDDPVRCGRAHTSQTFFVGRLDLSVDGKKRRVDAPRIQAQPAARCPARLPAHVGVTPRELRLTMLIAVWFTPSSEDSDLGARWFRCDVVALRRDGRLARLPRTTQDLLDREPERWDMCATAEPGTKAFRRVPCGGQHRWVAVSTVDLTGTSFPTPAQAADQMEAPCRAAARQRSGDPLDVTWSEERPTKAQWRAGRRYGICWAPA